MNAAERVLRSLLAGLLVLAWGIPMVLAQEEGQEPPADEVIDTPTTDGTMPHPTEPITTSRFSRGMSWKGNWRAAPFPPLVRVSITEIGPEPGTLTIVYGWGPENRHRQETYVARLTSASSFEWTADGDTFQMELAGGSTFLKGTRTTPEGVYDVTMTRETVST